MQNSDLQKYLKENPLLEDKNSNSEDFLDLLSEGLTEDESKAVLDKYKKRYAAVLKSNPDFIKKYPNPDKVIYGMVMNEVKRLREKLKPLPEENKATEKLMDDWGDKLQLLSTIDSKDEFLDLLKGVISTVAKTSPEFIKSSRFIAAMGDLYNQRKDLQGSSPEQEINEKLDATIKEVFSEKQRKYMCVMAQPGAKRPKGLSKADAKEMCADTKISKAKQEEQALEEIDNLMNETGQEIAKKNMDNYKRLNELVKAALMGPINETLDDKVYGLVDRMLDAMGGSDNLLKELIRAMSTDDAMLYLSAIARDYGVFDDAEELEEASPFVLAADAARDAGKKEFEFPKGSGKMHKVTIQAKIDETDMANRLVKKIGDVPNLLHQLIRDMKKLKDKDGKPITADRIISQLKLKMTPAEVEAIEEDKVKGSNIKKVGDKYRVLSGKTGKMWKQKYDSKEDAEAALRGYFASQNESLEDEYSEEEIKKMYSLDRGAPDPKNPHFKNIFKDDAITIPGLTERIFNELREEKIKLTPEEQKIVDDITESLNEGVLDFEKIKQYAKKGLMTAAILLSLNATGFSADQEQRINDIVKTEMPASKKTEIDRMYKISVVTTALQQYKRGKKLDKLDNFLKQDLEDIKNGPKNVDQVVNIFDFHQDALEKYVPFMF